MHVEFCCGIENEDWGGGSLDQSKEKKAIWDLVWDEEKTFFFFDFL